MMSVEGRGSGRALLGAALEQPLDGIHRARFARHVHNTHHHHRHLVRGVRTDQGADAHAASTNTGHQTIKHQQQRKATCLVQTHQRIWIEFVRAKDDLLQI